MSIIAFLVDYQFLLLRRINKQRKNTVNFNELTVFCLFCTMPIAMKVLQMGEQSLRFVSEPIKIIDESILNLVEDMFVTVKKENGIGLAAAQVGVNIRLFIVYLNNQKYTFINPEIIETSQEICVMEEGCLSIPKVYEDVKRPCSIKMQYMGLDGKRKFIEADGLFARVIQHEYDHLNGLLFVDRLSDEKKEEVINRFERKKNLLKRKRRLS